MSEKVYGIYPNKSLVEVKSKTDTENMIMETAEIVIDPVTKAQYKKRVLTKEQYDALPVKDNGTEYVIIDDEADEVIEDVKKLYVSEISIAAKGTYYDLGVVLPSHKSLEDITAISFQHNTGIVPKSNVHGIVCKPVSSNEVSIETTGIRIGTTFFEFNCIHVWLSLNSQRHVQLKVFKAYSVSSHNTESITEITNMPIKISDIAIYLK